MAGAPRPRGPSIAKSPEYLLADGLREEVEAEVTAEERAKAAAFVQEREAARQQPTAWEMMPRSWMDDALEDYLAATASPRMVVKVTWKDGIASFEAVYPKNLKIAGSTFEIPGGE